MFSDKKNFNPMKTLKEKFGKFELSNTQAKNVAGGSENAQVNCYTDNPGQGRRIVGVLTVGSPNFNNNYISNMFGNLPGFIGCF
ncbi:MAG: hypothetical protein EAZ57_10960 [Cytophagales bacterium]|nr:MAG: hypothetical protein EAZ67_11445 [Cytophagales bacterium]TAF59489.1 MAG: hypothetical protein EAZ57_10960 [Cytophagales bacterium]